MAEFHYHYLVGGALLRVTAHQRPYRRVKPYPVLEYVRGGWRTPTIPELPANRLLCGEYVGAVKVRPQRPAHA